MLQPIIQCIKLSVIILSVIVLSVVLLYVVAPRIDAYIIKPIRLKIYIGATF